MFNIYQEKLLSQISELPLDFFSLCLLTLRIRMKAKNLCFFGYSL